MAAKSPVPIATGEGLFSPFAFKPIGMGSAPWKSSPQACLSFAATMASAAFTASSSVIWVESRRTASAAGLRGESARFRSRSSRACSSRTTSSG